MKKFITIILGLALSLTALASVIGTQQAMKTAKQFFKDNAKTSDPTMTLVRVGVQTKAIAPVAISDEPTYYVYNRKGGGWVILAADDRVDPVIGYSMTGEFPSDKVLPGGLGWWLDSKVTNQIAHFRASGKGKVVKSNNEGIIIGDGDELLYETALWNQGSPYNDEAPVIQGQPTFTGCVATAAAIKCRFHRWPYKGSGTTPAYTYDSEDAFRRNTVPENKLGRVYDYDNMPLTYTSQSNAKQRAAVAALMYDLGTGCKMMYGWSGSGAYTPNLAYSMKTYFHYDKNLHLEDKDNYSNTDWLNMLRNELDEVGPIMYSGVNKSGGGHEFIFAGYKGTNRFYVNWGWGGSGNGWFSLNDADFDYKEYQDAILGCKPDKNGIYTPDEVAEKTCFKFNNNIMTISCEMECNLTITDENGKAVLTKNKLAPGTKASFTMSDLGGEGKYFVTVALTVKVEDVADSQYKFEIEL